MKRRHFQNITMTRPLSSNDINEPSNTRSNGEELSSVENQQEDVQTKNPSLVKQIQTSVIIGCSLISYLPFILQMYKTDSALIYVFSTCIQSNVITGIIAPSLFYYFNAKLREYFCNQFWNNVPDWLYAYRPNDTINISQENSPTLSKFDNGPIHLKPQNVNPASDSTILQIQDYQLPNQVRSYSI